tara:strand:+ start:19498 stop:20034 length:537 start_codon:yes stop_codon:yes gene_type:complete
MKKVLILMLTLFSISLTAQEINWMSFEEAIEAQKTTPKKIFIDAYTVWCGPCKMLDKNTFHNKDVVDYVNKNYYAVKFNAEGNETINYKGVTYTNPNFDATKKGRNSSHQLTNAFGIRAYPTLLYLDENANVITPITGYQKPRQLELYLKFFNSTDVKNINKESWESYAANFKPEFKD